MQYLRQSTAFTVTVGPILDSTGAEYTGAVIGDLSIRKHDGSINAMAAAATLTHSANGIYTLVGTTGNSDTLGRVDIHCNKSTYQMPPKCFDVIPAMVYDSFVLGTDRFDVNVTHIADTSQTARDIGASVNVGAISGDTGAADSLEAVLDGTGANLTVNSFGVSSLAVSGDVSFGTFHPGVTTFSAFVVTGCLTMDSGDGGVFWESQVTFQSTLTHTGAITATNASNDIRLGSTERSSIGTSVWATGTRTLTANTNLSILTAAQIATGVWQDTVAGDFTVSGSIGKSVMNGVSLGTGLTVAAVSGAVGSVTGAVGSVTGNVGGNVVGSVGSVSGAVGSVTGNVGGNVTGSVGSVLSYGTLVADIWAYAIQTGWSAARFLKNIGAMCVGKTSGLTSGAGTLVVRDVTDTQTQVTGVVTSDGNRTSVTPGS